MSPDDRFKRCIGIVCSAVIEGGYSNDPQDPGGPTSHGITQATLTHWRGRPCTAEDVKALTLAEAMTIYRSGYWAPVGGDLLPAGVDLMAFDAAVNQGPGTSAMMLQSAVGAHPDGHVGQVTLGLIAKADPVALIAEFAEERMDDYRHDAGWDHDGHGWANRVARIKATATAWVGT